MRSYLLAATLLTCTCLPAYATTIFNDGFSHNIDGSGPFDDVVVGSSTTANVLSGANVVAVDTLYGGFVSDGIYLSDTSIVNMLGGIINGGDYNFFGGFGGHGISAVDSTVSISGGTLNGGSVDDGGFGGKGLTVYDSLVNISGGIFNGGINDGILGFGGVALGLYGATVADVTGGIFNGGTGVVSSERSIDMSGTSVLNLSGGFLSHSIRMLADSVLNVYGTGLLYSGVGYITGTLADGTPINAEVYQYGSSQVNLYAVTAPEPSIIALFGLGLAGLGLARRRRQA